MNEHVSTVRNELEVDYNCFACNNINRRNIKALIINKNVIMLITPIYISILTRGVSEFLEVKLYINLYVKEAHLVSPYEVPYITHIVRTMDDMRRGTFN